MIQPTQLYRNLSLIRAVEDLIVREYPNDQMQTPVHLSTGEEHVAVALCAALTDADLKITTHRSHALYLANGGDLVAFFAELLGKPEGASAGLGGSMHLTDVEHGLLGTTSIVGGLWPIVCGYGEAVERPHIAVAVGGDGACDEGVFYESLNWAALRNLPVLFVAINNGLAVETTLPDRRANNMGIDDAAEALGVPARYTFLRSVIDLNELMQYHIDAIRGGGGPRFIEVFATRAYAHNGVERQIELEHDPLHIAREQVPDWQSIDELIHEEVEDAWREAVES